MITGLLSIGLLALLLFVLSFTVSMTRMRAQRGFGNDPDPTVWLTKIVRAQGNAAEYIPAFIVLIAVLEIFGGGSQWYSWLFIACMLTRYCHAAGMLLSPTLNDPHPLRFIGSAGTYICGFLFAIAIIELGLNL